RERCGIPMDRDGELASRAKPRLSIVAQVLANSFFDEPAPKSLDRFDIKLPAVEDLGTEEGAATLTHLTAACIARALQHCPAPPRELLITGGGRHNRVLVGMIEQETGVNVRSVDDLGWHGDAVEAQAFAYMAVRSVRGLPITFPGTTGVREPLTGGRLANP
ncbi:MAG: anhydro-N-acetylmuramic acid kinase, partial [Rhodospirillaceae bacterium]